MVTLVFSSGDDDFRGKNIYRPAPGLDYRVVFEMRFHLVNLTCAARNMVENIADVQTTLNLYDPDARDTVPYEESIPY